MAEQEMPRKRTTDWLDQSVALRRDQWLDDYNARRRDRYAQDPVYREKDKAAARERGRRRRRSGEDAGSRFEVYTFNEERVRENAQLRSLVLPDGRKVDHEGAYLYPQNLALAMGVARKTLRTWMIQGLWPQPLCFAYLPSRRPVYALEEAIAYARIFAETLGGVPTARPFVDHPELTVLLDAERERLRRILMQE